MITKHTQLFLHSPHANTYGDCYRTSIACLLNTKSPEDIPHLLPKYLNNFNELLKEMNIFLFENYKIRMCEWPVTSGSVQELITYIDHFFPEIDMLLGGASKNGNHAVVAWWSREANTHLIHDPSIDGSGFIGPMDDGYYWLSLAVRGW